MKILDFEPDSRSDDIGHRLGIGEDRAEAVRTHANETYAGAVERAKEAYKAQDQAALDEARQCLLEQAKASQQDALVAFQAEDKALYDMHIGMALGYWTAHLWNGAYGRPGVKALNNVACFVRRLHGGEARSQMVDPQSKTIALALMQAATQIMAGHEPPEVIEGESGQGVFIVLDSGRMAG